MDRSSIHLVRKSENESSLSQPFLEDYKMIVFYMLSFMKSKSISYCCLMALVLMSTNQFARAKVTTDSLLFSLKKDEKIIHVLGVSHIGLASQYPLKSEILEAFNNSEVFVNESKTVFLNQSQVAEILKAEYSPLDGKTLNVILENTRCKADLESIDFHLKVNQLLVQINPKLTLEKFKLLSPNALLHQLYFMGGKDDLALVKNPVRAISVELLLGNKARAGGKKIESLDPEFWQALRTLSDYEYCSLITEIVKVRINPNFEILNQKAIKNLLASIERSDSLGVQKYYFEMSDSDPRYAFLHRKWFNERNSIMTSKLLSISEASNGAIFVVIGAAHLGGDKGVIQQLKKMQFKSLKK